MQAAFDGLRVADLSDRLSAAYAGRLFADYGADVVLVESPTATRCVPDSRVQTVPRCPPDAA